MQINLKNQDCELIVNALNDRLTVIYNEAARLRDFDKKSAEFWDGEAARIEALANKFRLAANTVGA